VPCIPISAHTGDGVELLKETIRNSFLHGSAIDSREFIAISRARHRDALVSADAILQRFLDGMRVKVELELLAVDLRDALQAVGTVTGQSTPDDVLDLIFSSFCIGK